MSYAKHIPVFMLLVALLCCPHARAQYLFRHLDIADGLSDNQIRSLTMAPDGRLAVRTASILNLYNGFSFSYFYQDKWKEYLWSYTRLPREYHDHMGRVWMKEAGALLLLDLNTNRFIYGVDSVLLSLGVQSKIKDLFIDDDKNYWFVAEDNTFLLYNVSRQELKVITPGADEMSQKFGAPRELAQHKNLRWMIYSSGLIRCWEATSGKFVGQDASFLNVISDITDRLYIHPAENGDLWLMYNFAVHYYSRTEGTWRKVADIAGVSNFFTCMDVDGSGDAWVGTSRSGLRRIRCKTFDVEVIPEIMIKDGGASNNDIHTVLVDEHNGLWVGTLFQGLYYYHASMQKFRLVQTVKGATSTTNEIVRCFLEDSDGTVLVGTANGLFRYHPQTQQVEKMLGNLIKDLCLTLYRDRKGRIWVGTFLSGFFCIDGATVTRYNYTTENMHLYPNQNISRAIYHAPDGRYWVSVKNQGIGELDVQTGKIALLKRRCPKIASYNIAYSFYPVSDRCFAVVGEEGIYYYDTQADSVWIPELDAPECPKFRDRDTKYYCAKRDCRALEWFGTEVGIRIWDEKAQRLYAIRAEDGIPNSSISAIEEDERGVMWASSVAGISRIEVEPTDGGYRFEVMNFRRSDGLQSGKFYDRSSLRASDGTMYFGGIHGFNTFHPQNMPYNRSKTKPVFTALKLFNRPVGEDGKYNGRVILQKPISCTDKICLRHTENFISVEFAGLNFVDPSRTGFRYRLESYDKSWNEITTDGAGAATYTGLPSGRYRLVVYAANNDKRYGDEPACLDVEVLPPFWATAYAYVGYALLGLAAACFVVRAAQKRRAKKQAEREAREREKQKEALDQLKFRFFTNISHEFRTPLTLIMTPLSTLMQEVAEENLRQKLAAIYRSAENMLGLINQLLDFRKLEMGGEKLRLSPTDVVAFVGYLHASFRDIAEGKSIDFTFHSECKYFLMQLDKGMLQKIIHNLYSNALKFTPSGGRISTAIALTQDNNGQELVKIEVADTGCGIPEGELQTIFERFYQSDGSGQRSAGSGIGLHLAKEYAELHGGRITVRSAPGKGSAFAVLLPTTLSGQPGGAAQAKTPQEAPDGSHAEAAATKPRTLLVVEDNTELLHFLAEQLSGKFSVLAAVNGRQGEEAARKSNPDLVISDLIMPEVNGLELCRRLKGNLHTSHIPVILLTARLSDEARAECYSAGADSYIAKPFSLEVLLARISALIAQQEKRKSLFRKTIVVTPSAITATSLDEELVGKALLCLEKNMSNPAYSVDDLSADVALSRSHLYRKLEAILGMSPHEFMLSVRLKRAAQLLKTTPHNITEISEMVGFNTIRYFNRYFKQEFGATPSQYRAKSAE